MSSELFKLVEAEVMSHLEEEDAEDYEKLQNDRSKMAKVKMDMKQTFDEAIRSLDNATSFDDAFAFISDDRKLMIRTSLRMQSFNVEFKEEDDGQYAVLYTSLEGEPLTFLNTGARIDLLERGTTRIIFIARILLESVVLLLNLVGLGVPSGHSHLQKAVKVCTNIFSNSETLLGVIEGMIHAYKKTDYLGVSKSIFQVLRELFTAKTLSKIIKAIWQSMSWFDVVIAIVKALTFIATTIFSGLIATIARIISWVVDGAQFLFKLRDLCKLKEIEEETQQQPDL